jgi:hypothetical protein
MPVRLLKLPLMLALMVSIGLHWALLQSVAWVGMVVSYSQTDSFSVALEKTFDGQHACKLCHFVKEGQAQEKKQEIQKSGSKFEACLETAETIAFSPVPAPVATGSPAPPLARSVPPPLPPPRLA